QAGASQERSNPLDHGQVQRIVGRVAGMDVRGQELAGGFGSGGHELELGQVGAMVFAVAQLHQPTVNGGVEAVAGGAVQSDALQGDRVDVTGALPEVGLNAVPGLGVAQPGQQQGETVVAELDVAKGQPGDGLEAMVELVGPVADVGLTVIGPGEDVGDPEGDEPTEGESAVVRVRLEVRVEEPGKAESDEEAQDQWDVVNAFVTEAEGGGHGGAPARGGETRRCTAARSR